MSDNNNGNNSNDMQTCSICLIDIDLQNTAYDRLKPCNHCFHVECSQNCLKQKEECPNCRGKVENVERTAAKTIISVESAKAKKKTNPNPDKTKKVYAEVPSWMWESFKKQKKDLERNLKNKMERLMEIQEELIELADEQTKIMAEKTDTEKKLAEITNAIKN